MFDHQADRLFGRQSRQPRAGWWGELLPREQAWVQLALRGRITDMVEDLSQDRPLSYGPGRALYNFARHYELRYELGLVFTASLMRRVAGRRQLLGWTVVRAVDNSIDDSNTKDEERQSLVQRCVDILDADPQVDHSRPGNVFELMLIVYVMLERISRVKTLDALRDVFVSFNMDLERRGKTLSWEEYQLLLRHRAVRSAELTSRLLLDRNDGLTYRIAYYTGLLGGYIDDIRDLYKDLSVGYINITKEEWQELGIHDLNALTPEQVDAWVQRRTVLILKLYEEFKPITEQVEDTCVRNTLQGCLREVARLIRCNGLRPGQGGLRWPLHGALLLKWLFSFEDQARYESFHHTLLVIATRLPWGSEIMPSSVSKLGTQKAKGE